jgi:hypothetical protein
MERKYLNTREIANVRFIKKTCEKAYNINGKFIDQSKKKDKEEITEQRQIAMYLARKLYPKYPVHEIGFYIAFKDHATVSYACKVTQDRINLFPAFRENVEKIEEMVRGSRKIEAIVIMKDPRVRKNENHRLRMRFKKKKRLVKECLELPHESEFEKYEFLSRSLLFDYRYARISLLNDPSVYELKVNYEYILLQIKREILINSLENIGENQDYASILKKIDCIDNRLLCMNNRNHRVNVNFSNIGILETGQRPHSTRI